MVPTKYLYSGPATGTMRIAAPTPFFIAKKGWTKGIVDDGANRADNELLFAGLVVSPGLEPTDPPTFVRRAPSAGIKAYRDARKNGMSVSDSIQAALDASTGLFAKNQNPKILMRLVSDHRQNEADADAMLAQGGGWFDAIHYKTGQTTDDLRAAAGLGATVSAAPAAPSTIKSIQSLGKLATKLAAPASKTKPVAQSAADQQQIADLKAQLQVQTEEAKGQQLQAQLAEAEQAQQQQLQDTLSQRDAPTEEVVEDPETTASDPGYYQPSPFQANVDVSGAQPSGARFGLALVIIGLLAGAAFFVRRK